MSSKPSEAVKVIIRCRPMSSGERQDGLQNVVQIYSERNEIWVQKPNSNEEPKQFTFDGVFD